MLRVLLLCCGLLQGIQTILGTQLSQGHLQKGMEGVGRAHYPSLLPRAKEVSAEPAGALPRLGLEQMALEVQEADGDLVERGSVLEPQPLSPALQPSDRPERSPRRCVRLLESCLGHQVPCCDPCATCYCRFFNAFCYCRKISNTLPCGKN
ncbi:agouti-related protein isoform X2 [Calypte anna]|nr:agouti-related protein isoform X2 [Calypte anna]XP_030313440.1 agouti-related protein isoform X2 [Calypte anna]XP_030313441.1 agouti-related protein isoform X2 [Calypte anna]XP_030313442.1 agouti-related protein isoform X2 [Calypte anna]XP_030313443.1 agouti-related protein isoform X2 [Calypte anna]XP_030313444.1 agouti-related protein isoform X2 [Calypte anna]